MSSINWSRTRTGDVECALEQSQLLFPDSLWIPPIFLVASGCKDDDELSVAMGASVKLAKEDRTDRETRIPDKATDEFFGTIAGSLSSSFELFSNFDWSIFVNPFSTCVREIADDMSAAALDMLSAKDSSVFVVPNGKGNRNISVLPVDGLILLQILVVVKSNGVLSSNEIERTLLVSSHPVVVSARDVNS